MSADPKPGDRVVFRQLGRQRTGTIAYDQASDPSHWIVNTDPLPGAKDAAIVRHVVPKSACVKW